MPKEKTVLLPNLRVKKSLADAIERKARELDCNRADVRRLALKYFVIVADANLTDGEATP